MGFVKIFPVIMGKKSILAKEHQLNRDSVRGSETQTQTMNRTAVIEVNQYEKSDCSDLNRDLFLF